MLARVYDPPAGWMYGFPKQYKPLPGESLAETLLRDGYPQHEIDNGMANHVRFWATECQSTSQATNTTGTPTS